MKIFRRHKTIDIDKSIGNIRTNSTHYSKAIENSSEWKHYTTINGWYDCDCGDCPMGWEERNYEGACDDCGCLFDYDFNVPIWKCMLPDWIKKLIIKHKRLIP